MNQTQGRGNQYTYCCKNHDESQQLSPLRVTFWNCTPIREREDTFGKLIKLHILWLSMAIQYSTSASPVVVNTPETRSYYFMKFQTAIFQGIQPIAFGVSFPVKDCIYGYILCWWKTQKFKNEKTKISPLNFCMQNVDLEIQSLHSWRWIKANKRKYTR